MRNPEEKYVLSITKIYLFITLQQFEENKRLSNFKIYLMVILKDFIFYIFDFFVVLSNVLFILMTNFFINVFTINNKCFDKSGNKYGRNKNKTFHGIQTNGSH